LRIQSNQLFKFLSLSYEFYEIGIISWEFFRTYIGNQVF